MEPVEGLPDPQESPEDESIVPTGPWEEDENEDCPAYHTAAFRMYVMKVRDARNTEPSAFLGQCQAVLDIKVVRQ